MTGIQALKVWRSLILTALMGWTAWSWYNTGGTLTSKTGYPQVVSDYNGTPLANMGTYIYQQLLNYAGVTVGHHHHLRRRPCLLFQGQ